MLWIWRWWTRELARCAQCYLVNISVLIFCRDTHFDMSKRTMWKKFLESEEDKKKIAKAFKRIDEHTKNFYVRLSAYLNLPRSWCYVPQLKLTIERNTRNLRDSLTVRFSRKPMIDNSLTITLATTAAVSRTSGLALPGPSTMQILKGQEHCLAGLSCSLSQLVIISFNQLRLDTHGWFWSGRANKLRRDEGIGFLEHLQRQKVRIFRKHILESAVKVFELYGSSSSILELNTLGLGQSRANPWNLFTGLERICAERPEALERFGRIWSYILSFCPYYSATRV